MFELNNERIPVIVIIFLVLLIPSYAVDSFAAQSPSPPSDTTPPTATISYNISGPYYQGQSVRISATFNEQVSKTVTISISGANSLSSTSMSYTNPFNDKDVFYDYTIGAGNGIATVTVIGTDKSGNIGSSSSTFTIDYTPPDTTITSNPSSKTNSDSPSFSFSSNESPSTFECSLDSSAFAACSSPKTYSSLSDGTHTFSVRALAYGKTDGSPATFSWTIDTSAPDTTITSNPSSKTNSDSPSFSFSSNESPSTFECSLDSSAFAACSSPKTYSSLSDGTHTFSVRAKDAAGNTGLPTTFNWIIDTEIPELTLTISTEGPFTTYEKDTDITINAHFSKSVEDFPQITISGANTQSQSSMTKISPTDYSFAYTIPQDSDGTATVSITATDSFGKSVSGSIDYETSDKITFCHYAGKQTGQDGNYRELTTSYKAYLDGGHDKHEFDHVGSCTEDDIDTDGDGIPDKYDSCPTDPNNTCSDVLTAAISYHTDFPIERVTAGPFNQDTQVTITATFNKDLVSTPKIAIEGVSGSEQSSIDMVGSGNVWTYDYTVGTGDGTATVFIGAAIDEYDNELSSISNDTFVIDNTSPTADVSYDKQSPYKTGDKVTITTTTSESLWNRPEISISGGDTEISSEMIGEDKEFIFQLDVNKNFESGTYKVELFEGQDTAGNYIIPIPKSGGSFDIEQNRPHVDITYYTEFPFERTTEGPFKEGTEVKITATFNSDLPDNAIPKISISGANSLEPKEMTKVSSTVYYYEYTVGEGNGDAYVSISDAKNTHSIPVYSELDSGESFVVDNIAPIPEITFAPNGPYSSGTQIKISADFNEELRDSPAPQISISGGNTLPPTNMIGSGKAWTYDYTVSDGNGIANAEIVGGEDIAGNVIQKSKSEFMIDNQSPVAEITYSKTGPYKEGTSVTLTATFNKPIQDSPIPKISISGANSLEPKEMTKVSSTVYYYEYTAGEGNGDAYVSISDATDSGGKTVLPTPRSGATFLVDNVGPTATISYFTSTPFTRTTAGPYASGTVPTITATFDEDIVNSIPQISISGKNTLPPTNMIGSGKVWTYDYTVSDGNGIATIQISAGKDYAGNLVSKTINGNFVVDNTNPVVNYVAQISPTKIMIFFDEKLHTFPVLKELSSTTIEQNFFQVDGSTIDNARWVLNSGREIELVLKSPAPPGTINVKIVSGSLEDLAGNKIKAITSQIYDELETVNDPPEPETEIFYVNQDTGTGTMQIIPIGENYALKKIFIRDDEVNIPILRFEPTIFDINGTSKMQNTLEMISTTSSAKLESCAEISTEPGKRIWDGKLIMPTKTTVSLPGLTTISAVEFGASDTILRFSCPATVVLNDQRGLIPFITELDNTNQRIQSLIPKCTVDNPTSEDIQVEYPQACYNEVGNDIVIHTLTASKFATGSLNVPSPNSPLRSSSNDDSHTYSLSTSISSSSGPSGGFGGMLNSLSAEQIRTIFVGDTLTIRLDYEKQFGDIAGLKLYLGQLPNIRSMEQSALSYITFANDKLVITDKQNYIQDVKFTNTIFDEHKVIFFDIKFNKPIEISDVGIDTWNQRQERIKENSNNVFSVIEKEVLTEKSVIDLEKNNYIFVNELLVVKQNSKDVMMPVSIIAPEFEDKYLKIEFKKLPDKVLDTKGFLNKNGVYGFNEILTKDWTPGIYSISLFSHNQMIDYLEFEISAYAPYNNCIVDLKFRSDLCPVEDASIKEWIKQYVELWQFGVIDDDTFNQGFNYLIEQKIIRIPESPHVDVFVTIKEKSLDWYKDEINDKEFLSVINNSSKEQ